MLFKYYYKTKQKNLDRPPWHSSEEHLKMSSYVMAKNSGLKRFA